jgi:membrane protein
MEVLKQINRAVADDLRSFRRYLERFRWGRCIFKSLENYNDHGCFILTASLSFYAFISLIPLVILAFYVLATVIGSSSEALKYLEELLDQYLQPDAATILIRRVSAVGEIKLTQLIGAWWSIPAFIWSGVRFYESLHFVLTRAWGGKNVRPFIQRKLWTVIASLGAAVFFGASMVLTTTIITLKQVAAEVLGYSLEAVWVWIYSTLPWIFAVAMIFLIYKFMPNTFVPWRLALAAAIPVGILWEVFKRLFTALMASSNIYTSIYGTMSSVVLLMLWVYSSAVWVLLGAEYAAAWQADLRSERKVEAAKRRRAKANSG